MVLLRESGMTKPEIAAAMGVSLSTVNRAPMAYDQALKPKPNGGRPPSQARVVPLPGSPASPRAVGHTRPEALRLRPRTQNLPGLSSLLPC